MIDNKDFISKIENIKTSRNLTIEEISKESGITFNRLNNILYNRTKVKKHDFELLEKISLESPEEKAKVAQDKLIEQLEQRIMDLLKEKEHDKATINKLLEMMNTYIKENNPRNNPRNKPSCIIISGVSIDLEIWSYNI